MKELIEFVKHLEGKSLGILFIILFILIVEMALRSSKRKISSEYKNSTEKTERFGDIEEATIRFYRRNQHIDIARVASVVIGLVLTSVVFNVQALNILVVATGAFILILRDPLTSLVAYFYIISIYEIGDDVRVDNKFLGEIVRLKPFYVGLAGKDDNGDHNGKLTYVPNHTFLNTIIEEQELKTDDYRRVVMQTFYTQGSFTSLFPEWIAGLRAYLDELLPVKKTMGSVGNYKGYVGLRYKLRFDYTEKGDISVTISFVSKPQKIANYKESIIEFIESKRKEVIIK
jgi:hypothetical protein